MYWFVGWFWFYDISTSVGYSIPNLFIYINSSISNNSVLAKVKFEYQTLLFDP